MKAVFYALKALRKVCSSSHDFKFGSHALLDIE